MKDTPLWVPYVVMGCILFQPAVVIYTALHYGLPAAFLLAVTIIVTNIGNQTARKYYRKTL